MLMVVLQVHRLQLFDVVMQFRAIFSDDSSPQETVGGASSGTSTASKDGGAVYSWAQHRLCAFPPPSSHNSPMTVPPALLLCRRAASTMHICSLLSSL